MVWARRTLTTGESDPENALGQAVGLRVAECFRVEPPFGNPISYIVCQGFSSGKQEVEEKIAPAVLNVFFSDATVTFGQKNTPLTTGLLDKFHFERRQERQADIIAKLRCKVSQSKASELKSWSTTPCAALAASSDSKSPIFLFREMAGMLNALRIGLI
jgi:hypothetical protein